MEYIRGKTSRFLEPAVFANMLAGFDNIWFDLGTGDGRFVRHMAQRHPGDFFIGLDACRENLREHSRAGLPNVLYLIASAQALPCELDGQAGRVTINFPWGSLLDGLLAGDPDLMDGLRRISRPGADLLIRLNGGALAESGADLVSGPARIGRVLSEAGFRLGPPISLGVRELRACPTTWARRLAFGRDPRAVVLAGKYRS
jgi:16S rRNA (adenine(1408)-N(1))-methyltransferase